MSEIKYENDKINMAQFAPKQNLSVPNLISTIRILMIPLILYVYFQGHGTAAVVLIILSGVSDWVDGYIARHYNQVTTLGKVLDPLADKLTQISLAICLCFSYPAAVPLVLVLLAKELLMLFWGLRLLKSGQQPFSACWWGKVSTGMFYAGTVVILAFSGWLGLAGVTIVTVVIIAALLFSMLRYGVLFRKKIEQARAGIKTNESGI